MSARGRLATFERWQALLLVVLVGAWASVVLSPSFTPDPDGYYHVGVARRMIEDGWLRDFAWLPYTTLAEPYPDVHLGQHVVLIPLVTVLGVDLALRVGILCLSTALVTSLYLVLRRRGVRWPAPWIVLAGLSIPIALAYGVLLKGISTFLIVLVWFIDALWSRAHRRTFVLAALSVYVYVGAPILLPLVLVHVAVTRAWEGRWELRPLAVTAGGVLVAMVVNPFWPAHWGHIAAELASIVERDPALVPGIFRGYEWVALSAPELVSLVLLPLAAWFVVLARQLARSERIPAEAATAALCSLGLLGGAMIAGSKLLHLFALFSTLAIPMLVTAMGRWPRSLAIVAVASASLLSARHVGQLRDQMRASGAVHARDYAAMAAWLVERTAPNEVVITAWDDFPGLFAFGGDQRYVAGINVQFLRDHDRKRFDAYALLFSGMVEDPEALLPMFFDDARLIVVRRQPRHPGELALTERLAANPHFQEVAGPVHAWRVFELRRD